MRVAGRGELRARPYQGKGGHLGARGRDVIVKNGKTKRGLGSRKETAWGRGDSLRITGALSKSQKDRRQERAQDVRRKRSYPS